jgi:hypothetical protein
MPFISRDGNLIVEDDVSGWEYDIERKENVYITKSFGDPLQLTSVGDIPTDDRDPKFKHFVFAGEKDPEKKAWKDTPWFRVTTQYMDDENLWRFYSKYRKDITGQLGLMKKGHAQVIRYVPTFDDFQVQEYGDKANFHLPVWMLDIIIADGLIDMGKRYTRDSLGRDDTSATPWVTEAEVQDMMGIYEKRKANEDEDNELVAKIKEKYKEIKVTEKTSLMNTARSQQATEKAAEKERLQAQYEAEKALEEAKAERERLQAEKDEIAKMKQELLDEINKATTEMKKESKPKAAKK